MRSRCAVFFPTPGHQAEGADVVLGDDRASAIGEWTDRMRQRQRGTDPVGTEQRLEAGPLVLGGEAVERDGILALVVVDPAEHLVADVAAVTPRWWG